MAKTTKRRRIIIFSLIGLGLAALAGVAFFHKRDVVITVQTEKVTRRDITEKVVANGKIQPVLQVKISPEVSGEIIDLPIKEGQFVHKGDLLVKIKPDFYLAQLHQCEAGYEAALAGKAQAEANLEKAQADFKRNKDLFDHKLISESDFIGFKASFDVATAQVESALHQVESAKATVASTQDSLDKTTIIAPMNGTISKLNSRLGERVLGTVQNVGTEIMIIADLNEMEARVDLGENDVVLIAPGQTAQLEVDAFKDRKFSGTVTEVANSSNDSGTSLASSSTTSQDATKFQVRIRIQEKEQFKPGMSVTAEISTRFRTNVLTVPIASVTTRLPKEKDKKDGKKTGADPTGPSAAGTNQVAQNGTNTCSTNLMAEAKSDKKKGPPKPIEVVFLMDADKAKMVPVKIGISDDNYWEITDGLKEGEDVISGGYRAISRDLEDGKKIKKGPPPGDKDKDASDKDKKD